MTPPHAKNWNLHISGWIRSFWASFDILLITIFFFEKKSYGKRVDPPPYGKFHKKNVFLLLKASLTACPLDAVGSLDYYLLYCEFVRNIRERFLLQFILRNTRISRLLGNEVALMISILDPESSLLPEDVRYNWDSSLKIYSLSCDNVYNVHRKFDKFYQ